MALAHFQRTFTDTSGYVKPGLSVTVRRESDNGLAALFADAGSVTPKSNPFNTDANGHGSFYVTDGRYRIQATDIDWRNLDIVSVSLAGATFTGNIAAPKITASTGILFGTDTAAANTLDDYEEGTFTITISGMNTTWTSSTSTAKYIKIGNLVTVTGLPSGTSGTGLANNSSSFSLDLNGLPFSISSALWVRSAPVIGITDKIQVNSGYLAGSGNNSTTSISVFQNKDNGGVRTSPTIDASTLISIHFSFTYLVD